MKYIVIKDFKDLKDNGYIYRAGDIFPRPDVNVDENRIRELATADNVRKEILIRALQEPAPEPTAERKRRRKNVRENTEGD